jgi:type IV pilus assembly protein PilQ
MFGQADASVITEIQTTPGPQTSEPVTTTQEAVTEVATVAPVAEGSSASELTPLDTTTPADNQTASVTAASAAIDTKPKDTLSVDFPDEDIRNILRNVADLFELNIVVPDTLQGRTSIKLRDVSWRQIFKVVLAPVGYTFIEDGNIIKVVTIDSLAQEPLSTEVFVLNYARAEEIGKSIFPLVDSAGGGRVLVDRRINALIISERPSKMARITPVLLSLDKATEQVMIESKFVEVTNRDIRNIGVNWASLNGYQVGAQDLSRERTDTRTRGRESETINENKKDDTFTTTDTNPGSVITENKQIDSSLGSQLSGLTRKNEIESITTSVFSAADFNVILSALKTDNKSRLVSNPTVVTLNNTEANISIGEEYPIPSYTYNAERGSFEVSGFEYKNIGILLKVTPQINAQGFIRMLLEPEVSSQAGSTTFGGASGAEIPIIATRKTKTQVTLKDGFTMGIGGLVERTDIKGETKVPLLSSIPGLGHLFRSKSNNETARNLLIFITAKTVSPDGAAIGQVFDPRVVRAAGLKADQLPGYRDGSDPFGPSPEEIAALKAEEAKKAKSKK